MEAHHYLAVAGEAIPFRGTAQDHTGHGVESSFPAIKGVGAGWDREQGGICRGAAESGIFSHAEGEESFGGHVTAFRMEQRAYSRSCGDLPVEVGVRYHVPGCEHSQYQNRTVC